MLGPGDCSAAGDWTFRDAQGGMYGTIATYSSRLLNATTDVRLSGWREFYGQADGDSEVEGWDWYLNQAVSSDSTHLWHIHLSEMRCNAESWLNKSALLSVLRNESMPHWLATMTWPSWDDVVTPLELNSRGIAVWMVQDVVGAVPDGDFGPATQAAVRSWQNTRGLANDGVVGQQTWDALGQHQELTGVVPMSEQLLNGWPVPIEPDGKTDTRGAGATVPPGWR